jgi:hypothetical protein
MKWISVTLLLLVACGNAGSDLEFGPNALRSVTVRVFLDRDASGSLSGADTNFAGARVRLRPPNGGQSVSDHGSNVLGLAFFEGIPVGDYSVTVDPSSIGDSLRVSSNEPSLVRLHSAIDTAIQVTVRLSYPELSIRSARLEPPGRRLLIRGIILAGPLTFRDTTAHLQDSSGYLRLTRASVRGGVSGNNPGDTVAVIGTTSSRAGQPTLDQAGITGIGNRPAPVPFSITTAVAATAMAGTLDAALVVVTGAVITDTATVAPDFRLTVNDGAGPLTVLLDSQGGFTRSQFLPGRSMTFRGVLVPSGTGAWQLKPRVTFDVVKF